MIRPSNSGIATCDGGVQRGRARRRWPAQASPAGGQAEALEDRDVELGERADVPRLVVAARAGRRGPRAARREHRHDQRVGPAQRVEQLGFRRAQRRAEHRQRRVRPRPRSQCRAPRRTRCSRPCGGRGSRGPRRPAAVFRAGLAFQQAPGRSAARRLEAAAGQQHRVRQEGVQLGQVGRAAVRQVGVRLRAHAAAHGGQLHQLGVGGLLTAEDDDRARSGEQGVEPVLPGAAPAEQPDDDEVGAVQPVPGGRRRPAGRGCPAGRRRRTARALSRSVSEVDKSRTTRSCPDVSADTADPPPGVLAPVAGVATAGVSWLPDHSSPRPSHPAPGGVGQWP